MQRCASSAAGGLRLSSRPWALTHGTGSNSAPDSSTRGEGLNEGEGSRPCSRALQGGPRAEECAARGSPTRERRGRGEDPRAYREALLVGWTSTVVPGAPTRSRPAWARCYERSGGCSSPVASSGERQRLQRTPLFGASVAFGRVARAESSSAPSSAECRVCCCRWHVRWPGGSEVHPAGRFPQAHCRRFQVQGPLRPKPCARRARRREAFRGME